MQNARLLQLWRSRPNGAGKNRAIGGPGSPLQAAQHQRRNDPRCPLQGMSRHATRPLQYLDRSGSRTPRRRKRHLAPGRNEGLRQYGVREQQAPHRFPPRRISQARQTAVRQRAILRVPALPAPNTGFRPHAHRRGQQAACRGHPQPNRQQVARAWNRSRQQDEIHPGLLPDDRFSPPPLPGFLRQHRPGTSSTDGSGCRRTCTFRPMRRSTS